MRKPNGQRQTTVEVNIVGTGKNRFFSLCRFADSIENTEKRALYDRITILSRGDRNERRYARAKY